MTADYADGGAEDTSPTSVQVECSVTETVASGNVRGTRIRCPVGQGEPDVDVEYVFFANPGGLYAGERGAVLDEVGAIQATRAQPWIAATPAIGSSPNGRERSGNPADVCVDSVVQRSIELPGGLSRELYCVTWGCVGYAGMGDDAACFDAEAGLAFLLFDSREGPGRETLTLEAIGVPEWFVGPIASPRRTRNSTSGTSTPSCSWPIELDVGRMCSLRDGRTLRRDT